MKRVLRLEFACTQGNVKVCVCRDNLNSRQWAIYVPPRNENAGGFKARRSMKRVLRLDATGPEREAKVDESRDVKFGRVPSFLSRNNTRWT